MSWWVAKKPGICDIGTEILYFQCFVTTDMFLFCKPIFFSGNCRICRDLAFGSVKTHLKAILKKLDFSAQIDFSAQLYFFHELCPPGGRLSYEAYNVDVSKYHTCTCSLTLDLHLHFLYIFNLHLHDFFMHFLQNVVWLNTRTGLRYKRHFLHAPKYDE